MDTARVRVTYGVLGPLEAAVDGRTARLGGLRPRALLAALLLRAGEVVPTPVLVDAVWGDDPPASAANLVQGYVSGLRKELGRAAIETREPGYRLQVPADELDLRRFERLAADGSAALDQGRGKQATETLGAALALWRGPALADVTGYGLLTTSATRLDELRLVAQQRYAEALLMIGRARDAVTELEPQVQDHPLREEPRALLMIALYRCGRQADALEVYRSGRQTLVAELGIEPGAALRELENAILRQTSELTGPELHDGQAGMNRGADSPAGADVPGNAGRPATRTMVIGMLDLTAASGLLSVAEVLANATEHHELILTTTVQDFSTLNSAVDAVTRLRAEMGVRGVTARAAAFTSRTPGADLARLAGDQSAELLLVDAPDGLLADPRLITLLEQAICDVGILVAGPNRAGPVIVAFAGGDHDWAAVELGARYSRAIGAPLVLAGALTGISGRDASRLLADASIAVQRALGVAARPLLVRPDPTALVDAARDARLVVVGLTERWRHEGVGPVRTALATSRDHPTLLVRRGLRNNGWAARDAGTRFTWTIAGSG